MNLEYIMLSEINQSQILYDFTYMRYLEHSELEKESRMMVFKGCGEGGIRSYCLMSTEFQFYKGYRDRWW